MDDLKPRRRWLPRYSLRTFFALLTLFGCWLGWQVRTVRVRQQWLKVNRAAHQDQIATLAGHLIERESVGNPVDEAERSRYQIPWYRRLLRDEPIAYMDDMPPELVTEAKSLFPEADITAAIRPTH